MALEDIRTKITLFLEDRATARLQKRMQRITGETQKLEKRAKAASQSLGLMGKAGQRAMKDTIKDINRFKAELLSVMFFGMAIQRVFGGFLRTAFKGFTDVVEGTSKANNAVTRLTASFAFLKFTLIDSLLANPLFARIIEWAIELSDRIGDLSPKTQGWIAALIAVTAALGGIMMWFGIIGLGLSGLTKIGWVFHGTIKAISAAFAFLAANPIVLLIASLLAVIGVLFLLKNKFGSFGDAIKAWASGIVLAVAGLIQFVLNGILTLIQLVVAGLAHLANVIRRAAIAVGLDSIASSMQNVLNAAEDFTRFNFDLLTPTSEFLDRIGFNPAPAAAGGGGTFNQSNEFNIESSAGDAEELAREILALQEEAASRTGISQFTVG